LITSSGILIRGFVGRVTSIAAANTAPAAVTWVGRDTLGADTLGADTSVIADTSLAGDTSTAAARLSRLRPALCHRRALCSRLLLAVSRFPLPAPHRLLWLRPVWPQLPRRAPVPSHRCRRLHTTARRLRCPEVRSWHREARRWVAVTAELKWVQVRACRASPQAQANGSSLLLAPKSAERCRPRAGLRTICNKKIPNKTPNAYITAPTSRGPSSCRGPDPNSASVAAGFAASRLLRRGVRNCASSENSPANCSNDSGGGPPSYSAHIGKGSSGCGLREL
jgi:hypothetical protein